MWNIKELSAIGIEFEPQKHSFIYTFPPPKFGKANGVITKPHDTLADLKEFTLYIHIPFCRMDCSFCSLHRKVLNSDDELDHYLSALQKELELVSEKVSQATLKAIYFGGGTPSILNAKQVCQILNFIDERFHTVGDIEICLETAPDIGKDRVYWKNYFSDIKYYTNKLKLNRISLGIQSVNETSLKKIGRTGGRNAVFNLLELVNEHFDFYNVDFLLGWPELSHLNSNNSAFQLIEGIKRLKFEFSLPSISLYQLWDTESIRLTKGKENTLQKKDGLLKEKWILQTELFNLGYKPTITSAIVLDRTANTSEFMKRRHLDFCNIGIGSGAYSILPDSLIYRPREISNYEECFLSKNFEFDVVYQLTSLEIFLRKIIMGLRSFDWVLFNIPADLDEKEIKNVEIIWQKIKQLNQWHLLEINGNQIKLNDNSFLISNEISKFLHPAFYPQK